jgi:hypothetical protein
MPGSLPLPPAPPVPLLPVPPPPAPLKMAPDELLLPDALEPLDELLLPKMPLDELVAPPPLLPDALEPLLLLPLLLEDEELLLPHCAPQLFCRQPKSATSGWLEPHDAGGLAELAQLTQVWSLEQATSWAQQEPSMQASQAALPVGIAPVHCEPLLLEVELALVEELVLDDELLDDVLPPQSSGYMLEGSAPPGGATQS